MKHIAIIGASGFIGKSLAHEYISQKRKEKLFLFSRKKESVEKIFGMYKGVATLSLDDFSMHTYDIIINCSGIGDPNVVAYNGAIFSTTEEVDALIISYLHRHPKTQYINISSGASYGHVFTTMPTQTTTTSIPLNNLTSLDYYSIAKLHAEAKHRSFRQFSIVDIRVFAFFSRYIDPSKGFLMSEIVGCLQKGIPFVTTKASIVRDYSTQKDILAMIDAITKHPSLNDVFDMYSKSPVTKEKLLTMLTKKYGLQVSIQASKKSSKKVTPKSMYASGYKKAKKIGYIPKYTSLESIDKELQALLQAKK